MVHRRRCRPWPGGLWKLGGLTTVGVVGVVGVGSVVGGVGSVGGVGGVEGGGAVVPGAHCARVTVSLIRVTDALRASKRPSTVTALSREIESWARMLPTKLEPDPSVADEPSCQ